MLLELIIIALAAFIIDVLWVVYIRQVAKGNPLASAIYGSIIYVFGALITITYVSNPYMLIPAVVGGFFGTYVTVIISKKYERQESKDVA